MDNEKYHTTAEITQQWIESVRQWVASPEGQPAIVANLQRAHAMAARFREAECVKPETLLKPMTI